MPVFDISDVELVQPQNQGKGPPGDGPPEDGPPGDAPPKDGPPGNGPGTTPTQDEIQKDIEKKMAGRQEVGTEQDVEKARQEQHARSQAGKAGAPGSSGMDKLTDVTTLIGSTEPRNWKQLLKEMVISSVPHKKPSYAKPSRKAVVGASIAAQIGAGAMKPGQKTLEEPERKLCLVFDTSGSMQSTILHVMKLVPSLLEQANVSRYPLGVIFFAGDAEYYTVNIGENWYAQVNDFTKVGSPVPKADQNKPYGKMFTMRGGGGTVLSPTIADQCGVLASKGFNIVLFSDRDVLVGENWQVFSSMLLAHKRNVFFIASDKETWAEACKMAGQTPPGWSYIK